MNNQSIAIITARGGSKRIPRKNQRDFCGRPIIEYSIDAALASGVFQEVMVSTDDEEIAEVSRKSGANVPLFRSVETADDYATTEMFSRRYYRNIKRMAGFLIEPAVSIPLRHLSQPKS